VSHLTDAVCTSLTSFPSSNQVEDGDDCLHVPTCWRLHIWPTTACLSQLWRADGTFDLLTGDVLLFQEPRLYSAHATLRSLVILCGTVCQLTFAVNVFFIFIYLLIYLKSTTERPEGHLNCLKYTKINKYTKCTKEKKINQT